jgi:membrane protease YdiL (CAAX protease family)
LESPFATYPDPNKKKPVAPSWHLVCVFVLLAAWVALSLYPRHYLFDTLPPRISGYLLVLLIEWFIFAFIWIGLRIQGVPFSCLFGKMSPTIRKILQDLGLALLFLIVANVVLSLLGSLLHISDHNAAVQQLLPHTAAEIAVYLLVTLTAGICEETIFRGYLQIQFTSLTKSAALGVVIQGIVFGLEHAYQGWKMVIVITVYGWLFGSLALWRKSLRPGIIAHFLQDSVSGIFLARHL